jgi:hypothetical protein
MPFKEAGKEQSFEEAMMVLEEQTSRLPNTVHYKKVVIPS